MHLDTVWSDLIDDITELTDKSAKCIELTSYRCEKSLKILIEYSRILPINKNVNRVSSQLGLRANGKGLLPMRDFRDVYIMYLIRREWTS